MWCVVYVCFFVHCGRLSAWYDVLKSWPSLWQGACLVSNLEPGSDPLWLHCCRFWTVLRLFCTMKHGSHCCQPCCRCTLMVIATSTYRNWSSLVPLQTYFGIKLQQRHCLFFLSLKKKKCNLSPPLIYIFSHEKDLAKKISYAQRSVRGGIF